MPVFVPAMKAYMRSGGTGINILTSALHGGCGVSVEFHAPAALFSVKDRAFFGELMRTQNRSAPFGEEKNQVLMPEIERKLLSRPSFNILCY